MAHSAQPDPPSLQSRDDPGGIPTERVGWGFIGAYAFALFGVWMLLMTPATVSLALRTDQIDSVNAATNYSMIAGAGALVAIVANPLFGRLSDMTTARWGMRRPWMVFGVIGGTVAAVVMAVANSIGVLFAGWALMQFFGNAVVAALLAVIADRVPPTQRGLMSGMAGMTPVAGILVGTYFVQLAPQNTLLIFTLPAVVALIGVAVFVALLPDRHLRPEDRPILGFREFLGSFYVNPRRAQGLSWYLLSFFLIVSGLAVIQTYLYFVVQYRLGVDEAQTTTIVFYAVLVMNVISLLVSLLAGAVSDRLANRKPLFGLSAVALAAGMLVMVASSSQAVFFVGIAFAGVGYGLLSGLYIAVATDTMTDPSTYARDLGLVNIAYTLPYSLLPLCAPFLLGLGGGDNYTALLIVGAIASLAGVPLLLKVRTRRLVRGADL